MVKYSQKDKKNKNKKTNMYSCEIRYFMIFQSYLKSGNANRSKCH